MTIVSKHVSRRTLLKAAGATAVASSLSMPRIGHAQSKTLKILLVGDPFYYALDGIEEQFSDETGIEVTIESLSYEALQARLVSSFVSGQPDADVISVDNIWLGQYLESKWIKPLNDLIKADKDIDFKDFIPQVLYSMNEWRGQIGSLPVATYGQGVMYRNDFVEKAGITIPKDGSWTWHEYLETIKKMNGQNFDGNTMFGSVVSGQQPAPIVHMFTQLRPAWAAAGSRASPRLPGISSRPCRTPEHRRHQALPRPLQELAPGGDQLQLVRCRHALRQGRHRHLLLVVRLLLSLPQRRLHVRQGFGHRRQDRDRAAAAFGRPAGRQHRRLEPRHHRQLGPQDEAWAFVKWATSAKAQKAMALYDKFGHQFSDFARRSLYKDPDLLKAYPYLPGQLRRDRGRQRQDQRAPGARPIRRWRASTASTSTRSSPASLTPEHCAEETTMLWTNVLKGNFMIPY